MGPVVAGGLFSAASGKGRLWGLIPFGVFGGMAMLGCSELGIYGVRLERGWVAEDGGERSEEDRGGDRM